jgi:guanylate kinase
MSSEKFGKLIIISGPSGVGKGTIIAELIKKNPHLQVSVSATTRAKRPSEVEGKDYCFLTDQEFDNKINFLSGVMFIIITTVHSVSPLRSNWQQALT